MQLLLCRQCRLGSKPFSYPNKRGMQPLRFHRLGQIVQRMYLKRLHRILVMRGYKYHDRHMHGTDLLNDLEPIPSRHLDVEKQEIKPALFQRRNHFPSVAALPCHLHIFVLGQ